MATSTCPLLNLSSLIQWQTIPTPKLKLLVSIPNYRYNTTKSITILCSSSSSSSDPQSTKTLAPPPPNNHSVNHTTPATWTPHRKKKVVMRVGHAGIDFRVPLRGNGNLPIVKSSIATQKELEIAIYKAGGIEESNFGDSHKMGWATSSLIHEEVNSLSTMVSLKMEVPENAWIKDPKGLALADIVNSHLPKSIRVFSILPSQKRFNVEKECKMRKYCYLLPLEVIGITSNFSEAEVTRHLSEFNSILRLFEGTNLFHNYTVRSKHRKKDKSPESMLNEESESGYGECDGEAALQTDEMVIERVDEKDVSSRYADADGELVEESHANANGLNDPPVFAKWLYQRDEKDRVYEYHSRKIFVSSCGQPKHLFGASYLAVDICGESFMLDQVRKMVGTAVAVKRGLLSGDVISPLSFCKFTRLTLPTAPSELLFLQWNSYALKSLPDRSTRPEVLTMVESKEILSRVENFYKTIMLPQFLGSLDPLKSPWKEWVEMLDANTRILDSQLDEVWNAWIEWKEKGVQIRVHDVDLAKTCSAGEEEDRA
ncbi:hypothetical protein OSB04_001213 [Centaurea solstitialis]|uniref:Pseudouridine synthase I TruA alpha/beta domain-containing protein n=1 Tax=Centaurea solstitialis TaxID=347529 RepID=A0AA38WL83_9ASTR|nr:hypothetical protein OSB04_001213 [Centaurea solstitialis]